MNINEKLNLIELTNDNLKDLKYENIMFAKIAEGGAMGEAGGVLLLQKNMTLYHTNYCFESSVDFEKVKDVFPPLKTFKCEICQVLYLDEGWKWADLGMGNYLLIRETLYEEFMSLLPEEMNESEYPPAVLYNEWINIAIKILEKII